MRPQDSPILICYVDVYPCSCLAVSNIIEISDSVASRGNGEFGRTFEFGSEVDSMVRWWHMAWVGEQRDGGRGA